MDEEEENGSSQTELQAYSRFSKENWGKAVNIALLGGPLNFIFHKGFGKGFIPMQGDVNFATGLSVLLSTFIVYIMFSNKHAIYEKWIENNKRFMEKTVVTLVLAIFILIVYTTLKPVDNIGAFLYAGALMGFTATFHRLAIKNFMDDASNRTNIIVLKKAIAKIKKNIGEKKKLIFDLQIYDQHKWIYKVTERNNQDKKYKALISRIDGKFKLNAIGQKEKEIVKGSIEKNN
jgi:hypothetical protein